MRPVERGSVPKDGDGNSVVFKEYGDARDFLIGRIGDYCSYCENVLPDSIHIEHVRPKKKNPTLARNWSNLLLACSYCNPTKGDEDVVLSEYFWPDTDNTARAFVYDTDRAPQIAPGLSPADQVVAQRTLALTGIDREPGGHSQPSAKDRRWQKRREAWGVALQARRNISDNDTPQLRDAVVMSAIARGFWSVWMQVFNDDPDMRRRLINAFTGTAINCFGSDTRFIGPRPGGHI